MKNLGIKILIPFILLGVFLMPLAPAQTSPNSLPTFEFQIANAQTVDNGEGESINFNCGTSFLWGNDNLTGCVVALLYYILFVPLAFLARLAAGILDFFIYYSISSEAYNNEFVSKAWGTVRDVANIFFLLALIYVAIKTILGLNVTDNKKIIGWIIIVALLINFSLFITQVVIDASNVLARVFYHQIESVNANGATIQPGEGEKSITVNLVKVFEPQKVIGSNISDKSDIGYGMASIVIIIMAIFCGIMIYVFLLVSILFVSRVVGLWMAMIFSPLAFASKTVDFEIPGFGFREWKEGLIKNAFLAMVFIFFLYMISVFGGFVHNFPTYGSGFDEFPSDASGRFLYFMNLFIPFFIIMAFLLKAKTAAEKMAGETGKVLTSATKSTVALGGMALGGALAGGAMLSRQTLGATSKMVMNDSARKKAISGQGFRDQWNKGGLSRLNLAAYAQHAGKWATGNVAELVHKIPVTTKDAQGNKVSSTLGKKWQETDKAYSEKQHSSHTLDEKAKEELHDKDAKFKDLDEPEQKKIVEAVEKDEMAKYLYKGKMDKIQTAERVDIETRYAAGQRAIVNANGKTTRVGGMPMGDERYKMDDILKFSKMSAGMGEFLQALRKGSHDLRELSSTKVKHGFLSKLTVGTASLAATIVRKGIKTGGIEYGRSQKDFWSDLGTVIKDSVENAAKKMKVDVSIDTGGGHGGGGDKGHGGGGGGSHH